MSVVVSTGDDVAGGSAAMGGTNASFVLLSVMFPARTRTHTHTHTHTDTDTDTDTPPHSREWEAEGQGPDTANEAEIHVSGQTDSASPSDTHSEKEAGARSQGAPSTDFPSLLLSFSRYDCGAFRGPTRCGDPEQTHRRCGRPRVRRRRSLTMLSVKCKRKEGRRCAHGYLHHGI